MSEIVITTDGSINGTKLSVDGKEITKKEKVVGISLYASAPFKTQMGDIYKGGVSVSYNTIAEDGTMQSHSVGSSDTSYVKGIGEKIKQADSVIRYIGENIDAATSTLIDKIVAHCETNKISCKTKDVLASRTIESLNDLATDLGIKLEA
jgi:hypothetical protein